MVFYFWHMIFLLGKNIKVWCPCYTPFPLRRSDEYGRCDSGVHRRIRRRVHARSMEELEHRLQYDVSRLLHRLPHVHCLRNGTEDCLAPAVDVSRLIVFLWMAAVSSVSVRGRMLTSWPTIALCSSLLMVVASKNLDGLEIFMRCENSCFGVNGNLGLVTNCVSLSLIAIILLRNLLFRCFMVIVYHY